LCSQDLNRFTARGEVQFTEEDLAVLRRARYGKLFSSLVSAAVVTCTHPALIRDRADWLVADPQWAAH
jgi:hypothetical protein